ncbi:DNA polymerase/3'-5' exonuclease PolX [Pseudomonas knackmussii]|uniref:DNA polymerase/3'-5' exonuclease PolX n=1 Tax=Pseudomonas knackmussii TaxID=65741 RepID=UPI00191C3EAB|nr:DNA polymerase/3'-5' exonuclease PolX [Pseudomonas knackmussii]
MPGSPRASAGLPAVDNERIARVFEEIADLLELEVANPFRIRAYRNAARSVRGAESSLAALVLAGEPLPKLPGIGEDLAEKIQVISRTGTCPLLERLHGEVPAGQTELLHLPSIGPKRVRLLHQELGIDSLQDLQAALGNGRLARLHGFGPRLLTQLATALKARSASERRHLQPDARAQAEPLLRFVRGLEGVTDAQVAGSLRRRRDTIGDLDIVLCAEDASRVMATVLDYPPISEVMASGETRSSVRLDSGLQVDFRIVGRQSFGAALQYFTGSKAHGIALRRRARERGCKLNEYGLFRGDERLAGETEEGVYRALGLPWIVPELREDSGEIDAAERGALPNLVELRDLRGDLHCHTRDSDGSNSLRDMALAAQRLGWEYLAITDHSQHLNIAHGMDAERLARQLDEIDRVNEELDGLTLLKGCEVDILADGSLDLPDSLLERLDIVVGAVHGYFRLSTAQQTRRILRAMDSPWFTVLAHPTGRLLLERDAFAVDMRAVIRHARQRGCFLELNAQPQRLDLDEHYCRLAKEEGVLVSIASDAHRVFDFALLDYGVGQARRGWLERGDVLNTRSLAQLRSLLQRSR